MYRNGYVHSSGCSTLAAVIPFLISEVAAEDESDEVVTYVAMGIGIGIYILLVMAICLRKSSVSYAAITADLSCRGLAQNAINRIHDQRTQGQFEIIAPCIASGRYRGFRERWGAMVEVEYNLIFSPNGSIQGTLIGCQPGVQVEGWYYPRKRVLRWAEGNHPFIQDTLGISPSYTQELKRLSNVYYPGTLRHAEVLLRVVEGDSGDLTLVGEYISSDGSQGDQFLRCQPAPLSAPAPDSLDEMCIGVAPLALQDSESMETKMARLEPTLEKEAL